MYSRTLPLIFLLLSGAGADYMIMKWVENNNIRLLIAGLLLFLICDSFRIYILKNDIGLGIGSLLFAVGTALTGLLMGYFIFGENLTTLQIIGCILGLISVFLISLEGQ